MVSAIFNANQHSTNRNIITWPSAILATFFAKSELICLINKAEIFVSNSTGPIHISAALNKYTIGFYPKLLACSAERWGPYTTKALVFKPETDCKACSREQCKNIDCMNSIQMPKVFVEIKKIHKLITNNEDRNV